MMSVNKIKWKYYFLWPENVKLEHYFTFKKTFFRICVDKCVTIERRILASRRKFFVPTQRWQGLKGFVDWRLLCCHPTSQLWGPKMETEAKINVKEIDSSQKSPTQAWQECQEFPAKRISSEFYRKGFIRWKEIVFEIFSPAPGFVPDEVLSTTGIYTPY